MSAPMPSRSARVHGRPAKAMLPDVGRSMPHTILSSVDFPAPFGPKRPYTEPSGTCSDT